MNYSKPVTDLTVSIPSDLESWVQSRLVDGSYVDEGDYLRDLIRRDQQAMQNDRQWLRAKIEEGLETLANGLLNDPQMQDRVARLKEEVLANPAMARWLDGMWERARRGLLRAVRNPERLMSGSLGLSVEQLGKVLAEDERLQLLVNRFARRTLVGAVSRYGDEIVRIVSETVKRWDARTVTGRIEGAVGRDLQFIRINGTLVGGLVGVCIHAVDVLL